MNNICIIPARSGSKRIKNKNLKIFFKKPLIYWSIAAAIKSKLFKKIIVSTDDKKIASHARKFGAEIPFLRSKKNSSDSATVHSVVIETIEKLLKLGINLDNICCLLPTAVLIEKKHLKQSFDIFKKKQDKFLIGVSKFSSPPQKGFLLKSKSNLSLYDKKKLFNKTQDYENIYYDAGQLYWGKFRNYLKNRDFRKIYFNNKSAGFVMNQNEIQDIDNLDDLELAKIKFIRKKNKKI
jgi:pseudaminic acid cytidylyltransferase